MARMSSHYRTLQCLAFLMGGALGTAAMGRDGEVLWGERLFFETRFTRDGLTPANSCATCHVWPASVTSSPIRNAVPARADGQRETARHAQGLADALEKSPEGWGLFHWDGEFASVEELIKGTFTGRNFGWLPDERNQAVAHFAQVMRGDFEIKALANRAGVDLAKTSDEEVLDHGAKAVVAYLKTLRSPRDGAGNHRGSAYDAFLAANRLPAAPQAGETPHEYSRRLNEFIAAMKSPKLIDGPAPFGELELRGIRIFFRGTMGYVRTAAAGNCAECHVPPDFTDFAFHNTGVTQSTYDGVHGAGAFASLVLPDFNERARDPARWLPPSPHHPRAPGRMGRSPQASIAGQADLGLWNTYGNADRPAPQSVIERRLNPGNRLTKDEVLALTVGRFKTPGLRGLNRSAPYLSSGGAAGIEEVLDLYRRMSELARDGRMRNAPLEFSAMRLSVEDIAPLAAFLRSLNEVPAQPAASSVQGGIPGR